MQQSPARTTQLWSQHGGPAPQSCCVDGDRSPGDSSVKLVRGTRPKNVEGARGAIWVWPAVAGLVSFTVATVLTTTRALSGAWANAAWPGDSDSASTLVQVVAASVITVTTLTFSLTVLTLQLASQQFSPRLLRQFTRDPATRVVLSVLVASFVMAMTVLRNLRADTPVPHLAVLAVMVGGFAALAALLGFITHIVRSIRIDTMMATVHSEAQAAINAFYPSYGDDRPRDPTKHTTPADPGQLITAARSGFVRVIDVRGLVSGARDLDAVVQLMARPGDHVVRGTPLGIAWDRNDGLPRDPDAVSRLVCDRVEMGYERTVEQDSAFGFRQLEDIAVKALSPGINDPVTAAHAIGYMADLLVQVLGCRLGPTVHEDRDGVGRAIVPDRDIAYYLDLCCGQVRRYGRREPTVLNALLRLLRDAAVSARDHHHREAIAAEAQRIVDSVDETLLEDERQSMTNMASRVHAALAGKVVDAYSDRSGETRSI